MFEYKVRCRHKLGWKEIKLYADTDIEEFFNRNSIDYVRNITDTAEHRQLKEIERLKDLCNKYEEEHKTTFEEWKKAINIIKEVREKILSVQIPYLGLRSGKTFIATLLNDILEILGGENNDK